MPDLFTLKVDVAQLAAAGKHFAEAKAKMPSALAHAVATIGPQANLRQRKGPQGASGVPQGAWHGCHGAGQVQVSEDPESVRTDKWDKDEDADDRSDRHNERDQEPFH
jgi:hypothetical protein